MGLPKIPWNKGKKGVQPCSDATRKKMSEGRKGAGNHRFGTHQSEESKKKNSESNKRTYEDPAVRKKNSDAQKKKLLDPVHLINKEVGYQKRSKNGIWLNKLIERNKTTQIERLIGGFWYGNVQYPEDIRTVYCAKFNTKFKNRCRVYWGNKSVLSGKTREENLVNGVAKELTVHHVYYQPKACCSWDEDKRGYYVVLNLGTRRKPNKIRYDIRGDPNKFVTLTHAENTTVNYDKIKWIAFFEELIASRDNKCYLTDEEMRQYNKNI